MTISSYRRKIWTLSGPFLALMSAQFKVPLRWTRTWHFPNKLSYINLNWYESWFFSLTPVVTSHYHGIKISGPCCLNVGQRYPPEKYNRCQEDKCYENQLRYPLDSNSSSGFRTTGAWMTNFMDLILFHLINFLS